KAEVRSGVRVKIADTISLTESRFWRAISSQSFATAAAIAAAESLFTSTAPRMANILPFLPPIFVGSGSTVLGHWGDFQSNRKAPIRRVLERRLTGMPERKGGGRRLRLAAAEKSRRGLRRRVPCPAPRAVAVRVGASGRRSARSHDPPSDREQHRLSPARRVVLGEPPARV